MVRSGEAVKLGSAAKVNGTVTVKPGGALDVEGATLSGALSASKAALVRICGASIAKALKVAGSAGSVVIGDGTPECAGQHVRRRGQGERKRGGRDDRRQHVRLLADGDRQHRRRTTVTNNKVAGSLTVTAQQRHGDRQTQRSQGKSKLQ